MILGTKELKEPKVSLIITYFNLGNYIKDCVSSILGQSYQNFEIIIVNDNSDEKNSKILEEIKNPKIKIINLKENKGQLLAFLEGLKVASGEFVCMVDADDILLKEYLKTLLFIHQTNKAAFVSSNYGEINEKNEVVFLKNSKKQIFNFKEINELFLEKNEFEIVQNKLPFGLWGWNPSTSSMMRKKSLEILDYFPDKAFWKTGADKVIFSLLHLTGGSINTDAPLYMYRHHGKNNSDTGLVEGKKKYLKENYIKTLIYWNFKLRKDAIKMFFKNKKELIEKYNKLNYYKMLFRVIFCVNIKVCAKILKTLAHKLIF